MHNASPNDRPTAPARVPSLTPLLCSESQWQFLLRSKCLFPRTSVFSPPMTETLTVLSISSAGVAALTSPGALRAHFPPLLQPLLPKFEETDVGLSTTGESSCRKTHGEISDSQEEI
jgi:hypothetical protein